MISPLKKILLITIFTILPFFFLKNEAHAQTVTITPENGHKQIDLGERAIVTVTNIPARNGTYFMTIQYPVEAQITLRVNFTGSGCTASITSGQGIFNTPSCTRAVSNGTFKLTTSINTSELNFNPSREGVQYILKFWEDGNPNVQNTNFMVIREKLALTYQPRPPHGNETVQLIATNCPGGPLRFYFDKRQQGDENDARKDSEDVPVNKLGRGVFTKGGPNTSDPDYFEPGEYDAGVKCMSNDEEATTYFVVEEPLPTPTPTSPTTVKPIVIVSPDPSNIYVNNEVTISVKSCLQNTVKIMINGETKEDTFTNDKKNLEDIVLEHTTSFPEEGHYDVVAECATRQIINGGGSNVSEVIGNRVQSDTVTILVDSTPEGSNGEGNVCYICPVDWPLYDSNANGGEGACVTEDREKTIQPLREEECTEGQTCNNLKGCEGRKDPKTPPCLEGIIYERNIDGEINYDQVKESWTPDMAPMKYDKCLVFGTATGGINTTPEGIITSLLTLLLSISGGIALIIIIYAGYTIMIARGDPEKLQHAKDLLTSAIIGLLFLIFSIVILEVLAVDILQIPGFEN
jgi:hypothetical protein